MRDLEDSPAAFFYYTSLKGERKDWLRRLLVQHEIYFRSPSSLNDFREFRPEVSFAATDIEKRQYVKHLLRTEVARKLPPARRLQTAGPLLRRLETNIDPFRQEVHRLLQQLGVLSLSDTLDEDLLWAHYADGCRGVCVEFDPNKGLFLMAQKVEYTDTTPVLNRIKDGRDGFLTKAVFTKRISWQHEKEWRVIARWDDEVRKMQFFRQHKIPDAVVPFFFAQHGPGYYDIPADAIRRVIIGSRCPSEDERDIQALLHEGAPHATIERQEVAFA